MTAATMPLIVDGFGKKVELGEVLGRGGEGEVYVLRQHPQRVAKLYHNAPNETLSAKLRAMVAQQDQQLLRCAAWPLDLLYDQSNPHRIVGFVMPRVRDSKPLHILYGPKTRKEQFPKANYSFILHTAANVARLFAAVHAAGHVIGDVNHANLLLSPQGTVWSIDCDSFQINDPQTTFTCDVGVLTHQSPELQQLTSFRGVKRTANHDRFGMAVLIFQLLMMGRHPFAGKTGKQNELTLEQAIQSYCYVYGSEASKRNLSRPPGSLPTDILPVTIQRLFERAFSVNGSVDQGRPSAEEWIQALENARRSIRTCNENSLHQFFSHQKSCIWCDWVGQRHVEFFPNVNDQSDLASPLRDRRESLEESSSGSDRTTTSVRQHGGGNSSMAGSVEQSTTKRPARNDEQRLWFEIQAIPAPKDRWQLPRLSQYRTRPTDRPRLWRKRIWTQTVFAGLSGLLGVVGFYSLQTNDFLSIWRHALFQSGIATITLALIGYLVSRWFITRDVRRGKWHADTTWRDIRHEAKMQAKEQKLNYDQVIESFAELRTAIVELPSYRLKRMQEWIEQLPERQLKTHLQQFRLDDAKIQGIGEGRKMVLQSYGIETAADVTDDQLKHIPGIGQSIREALVTWKDACGHDFQPDPRAGLTRMDHIMLDREVAVRRDGLLRKLELGIRQVQELRELQDQLQVQLIAAVEDAAIDLAEWLADEEAMLGKQKR